VRGRNPATGNLWARRTVGLDGPLQLEVERQPGNDLRSLAGRTVDAERAAERLDPVVEADDSRPAGGIRPADAVVANRQQVAVAPLERDVDTRGVRMLGRVGKSFGCNEVRRYLDRLREPHVRRDGEVDRYALGFPLAGMRTRIRLWIFRGCR